MSSSMTDRQRELWEVSQKISEDMMHVYHAGMVRWAHALKSRRQSGEAVTVEIQHGFVVASTIKTVVDGKIIAHLWEGIRMVGESEEFLNELIEKCSETSMSLGKTGKVKEQANGREW